jgi:coenzyme PQQ precursor peptide PqqA
MPADPEGSGLPALPNARSAIMAWKKPTVAEVQVGMEINMYACAKGK